MSAAPTPPPHTPVNFVLGGSAGFFTAACITALAKVGYSPEDFGSYNAVYDRISQARSNVNAWREYRAGRGPRPRDPKPTPEERRLAGCQSGHLEQNAAHQTVRGDPCSNPPSCRQTYVPPDRRGPPPGGVGASPAPGGGFTTARVPNPGCHGTPGYLSQEAPCMPHQGAAQTPGTGHNFVTCMECDDARANGPADAPYSRERQSADADRRTERLLDEHGNGRQPAGQATTSGGSAAAPNPSAPAAAGKAGAASAGATTSPAAKSTSSAAAQEAADCINAFRKAAMQQMLEHCKNGEEGYNEAAGSPAQRQAAQDARDQAHAELRAAEASGDPERLTAARGAYNKAATAHNRMQRAACMAEQSRALQGGPPGPCRTPSTAFDPRGETTSGSNDVGDFG